MWENDKEEADKTSDWWNKRTIEALREKQSIQKMGMQQDYQEEKKRHVSYKIIFI